MKNIYIKKSKVFSSNSKIILFVGERKIDIKGFGLFTISVNEGQSLFASQLWTKSNRLSYEDLHDGSTFLIKPKLGRMLALIFTITFLACSGVFILTKFKWSFVPLLPFVIYIALYLTVLKDGYLIIDQVDES